MRRAVIAAVAWCLVLLSGAIVLAALALLGCASCVELVIEAAERKAKA